MHSYARIHNGTQNGSWHGTTVQLVQPSPSLCPIENQGSLIEDIGNMEITTPKESVQAAVTQTDPSLTNSSTVKSSSALTSQDGSDPYMTQPHQSLSRKRPERSSPMPSPLQLTCSPAAKAQRRARIGTECNPQPKPPLVQIQHSEHVKTLDCMSLNDFMSTETENEWIQDLQCDLFSYMLQKSAVANTNSEYPFINIQDYFRAVNPHRKVTSSLSGSNGCHNYYLTVKTPC